MLFQQDPEEIQAIARDIGYPLMIKATAGGGGRGMRVVEKKDQTYRWHAEVTMQEAKNGFGNETIYLEKFIANPRHIEVQIVGDGKGKAIHLGTRDCSMQRRHQKIIEEAPASNLNQNHFINTLKSCLNYVKILIMRELALLEFLYEEDQFLFHRNEYKNTGRTSSNRNDNWL